MSVESNALEMQRQGGNRLRVFRGLLWREWLRHRGLVTLSLAAWIVLVLAFLAFTHPVCVLAFGVVYAWVAGIACGGADASEGSEEFSFSLPPTRGQRYVAALTLGGGTLVGFTAMGLLAIALDLPQLFWSLFVSSGYTEPFPPCTHHVLYGLALAHPLAVFACTFAVASNAKSRGAVSVSWFLGTVIVAGITALIWLAEYVLWSRWSGLLMVPALLAITPIALQAGYLAYVRKEGISRPAPVHATGRMWVWLAIALMLLAMLLLVGLLSCSASVAVAPSGRSAVSIRHPRAVPPAEQADRPQGPQGVSIPSKR